MKIYIYTIPKAGTYFLADLIERFGFKNTGFHVSQRRFLNTKKFDLETNARTPSKTMERQVFLRTLNRMNEGEIAFGHFPAPMMSFLFPDFVFVCAYRHPRKTLVSEFVDFRFRRDDVKWLSPASIHDDQDAFCMFLERHGPVHMSIFAQMLGVTLLIREPLCHKHDSDRFHMLNFDALLRAPEATEHLAAKLGKDPACAAKALSQTLAAETKTKATGLTIDRAALWSDKAEALYAKLGAESYVRRGRELGWDI